MKSASVHTEKNASKVVELKILIHFVKRHEVKNGAMYQFEKAQRKAAMLEEQKRCEDS